MGVNVVKLEDVCEFYRGLTYSKKDEATFSNKIVLRASNIDLNTSTLDFDDLKYLREDFNIPEDKKLRKDCIFICMSSGSKSHLGKVAFIDKDYDYAFGGFMGMIKPKANILPKYLFYLLQTPEYKELLRKLSNGININNIKFTDLKDFEFELPTIDEQEKILNTLDKADEIRTKKRLANDKLDEFLKSTFISMFGDPRTNSKGWDIRTLNNIVANDRYSIKRGPFGGSLKKEIFKDSGYLVYEQTHAIHNDYNFARYYIDERKYKEMEMFKVVPGDLIISCSGVTLGRISEIPQNAVAGIINQALLKISLNHNIINNAYFISLFRDRNVQSKLFEISRGSGIPNLPSVSVLKELQFMLPPIELQNKFAQIVEKVETQKQKNEQVIEQMDNLFNSLSQRAFKGEL